jgi:hypothetical protein
VAVSVLAVGDTFTAAVENDIANQINQMRAFMTLANPNVSTPASGTATWVTMGNITVPTWATKGRVCLIANGLSATSGNQADIAVKIGTSTGGLHRWQSSTANRFPQSLNDLLTSVPTGSQSVTVQATFVTAGGTLTAPSSVCVFDLNIDWMQ